MLVIAALDNIQDALWLALRALDVNGGQMLFERLYTFVTGTRGRLQHQGAQRMRIVIVPRAHFGAADPLRTRHQVLRASTCERALYLSDYRRATDLVQSGSETWFQNWVQDPSTPHPQGVLLLAILSSMCRFGLL